jgi:ubiquitin C-terminal hydrolase
MHVKTFRIINISKLKIIDSNKIKINEISTNNRLLKTVKYSMLSNISELSQKLLNIFNNKQFDIDKQPLTVAFSILLFELINYKKTFIVPSIIKEILGQLNPLFEGLHAADPKDLIFFIIEKLHKELNQAQQIQQQICKIDYQQQELDSRDEKKMFNKFINDSSQKNNSFISRNFYGIHRISMKCESCGVTQYSFKAFNLLIFQLKKVKEEMKKELGKYYQKLNLFDAFEVERKEELLKGENMIYCNACKSLKNGKLKQQIFGLPSVMIIILDRGKDNTDFNEEFDFPEKLDFSNTNIIINKNSYQKFFLCGVITYLGGSGSSGHYISYCRSGPNNGFICYNDSSVFDVSIKDAISTTISAKDYEKRTPYILIYHKI